MKRKIETMEKMERFISGYELVIKEGKDRGRRYSLDFSEVVLGRAMSPEEKKPGWILFSEPSVSRMHAILEWNFSQRTYRLNHRSSTNPTLVNGKLAQQVLLGHGDTISLGDLVLEYRQVKETREKEEHDDRINSGLKFVVLEGPDKGKSFTLSREMVAIGARQKPEDAREDSAVLLDDEELPHEAAFLLWNEKKKNYEFFPNRDIELIMILSRISTRSGEIEKQIIRESFPLKIDDVITIGKTRLVLMREEPFIETSRARHGIKSHPRKRPSILREKREPEKKDAERPSAGLPPKKIISPSGSNVPSPSISQIIKFSGDRTYAWQGPPGFMLDIVEGPDRGTGFSILPDSLEEGRIITLGKQGRRLNDIPIGDRSIASEQASLVFKNGKLGLLAESQKFPVILNGKQVEPGKLHLLKNGDRIRIGQTLIEFFDGTSGEKLRGFELKVIEGKGTDLGKTFTLGLENTIGRGTQSDIRIYDPEVSRTHAIIRYREQGFILEHKSTVNPTFVNGVSVARGKEKLLKPNDRIRLSRSTLLQFTYNVIDIDKQP
ncbi:MAG: FHA domain-containing protein [Candidatus Eremiobacteraeota bacterium]|nr:FHA domain-containing protein [Candidatus Eremiobacteraeota bacterium]